MESLKIIENLAARARREETPLTDVRLAAVIRAVRAQRQTPAISLAWPAFISAVATCALLAITHLAAASSTTSSTAATASTDPIAPLFNSVYVEMP